MMNFFPKSVNYGSMRLKLIELFFVLILSSCAYCLELPDEINGWQCVNEYIVPLVLDVNSADMGTITYRDYTQHNKSIQIILTQGKGTGELYVPEKVRDIKGIMPSGSGYEVLEVSGFKSVLERHEYMPLSLAVNVSKDTVITFESSTLNDRDIAYFANSILSPLR